MLFQDILILQPTVPHCLDYSQFRFFYPSVFDSVGESCLLLKFDSATIADIFGVLNKKNCWVVGATELIMLIGHRKESLWSWRFLSQEIQDYDGFPSLWSLIDRQNVALTLEPIRCFSFFWSWHSGIRAPHSVKVPPGALTSGLNFTCYFFFAEKQGLLLVYTLRGPWALANVFAFLTVFSVSANGDTVLEGSNSWCTVFVQAQSRWNDLRKERFKRLKFCQDRQSYFAITMISALKRRGGRGRGVGVGVGRDLIIPFLPMLGCYGIKIYYNLL